MLSYVKRQGKRIWMLTVRELRIFIRRPLLVFCMLIAPIFCAIFFSTMMSEGLPQKLPTGLVDEDNTSTTRQIVRILGSMKTTDLSRRYPTFEAAKEAVLHGEIYAFMYIPKGTTQAAISSKQPQISFYTNDAYFLPASLLMKDLRTTSEMTGLAITRETLRAKGLTDKQIMGVLQPIVIESHPISNSTLNYSVLLTNCIVPGIVILMIMLTTTYAIGMEWKKGTQKFVYHDMAGGSVPIFITGKLLPQTVLYVLQFWMMYVYLYKVLCFPCQSGLFPMMCIGVLTVLAAQAFGLVMFGIFAGQMRMSMSASALVGVLSISMAGFSYPTTAMSPLLIKLSWIFPLRDYFLIYSNQALNGYPIEYAWQPILALLIMMVVPLLFIKRYAYAINHIDYVP